MAADQQEYEHDYRRAEDHAHDDDRGVGQADQVQPLCSRSALLGFGGGPGGGGTRGPRRPLKGRHVGRLDQFHDKLSPAIRFARVIHRPPRE